jgi:hypothetical protein
MARVPAPPRRRVAVADDSPTYRRQKCQLVQLAGFEAVPLQATYHTVPEMISEIRRLNATALVCDHKLSEGNYAGFQGAEAVAAMYGTDIAALLVTDYLDSDLPSITRYRSKVPVLIRGNEMRPALIVRGVSAWEEEVVRHEIPPQRRPRRAVVMVDDVTTGQQCKMLTVFVPRWRERDALRVSDDLLPETIRAQVRSGLVLTASINTEAERREDLFFEDFELTPDEDLEHEPA